jgi:hypothetical protein
MPTGGDENSGQIKVTFPTHGRRATYFKLFKNKKGKSFKNHELT